MAVRDRNVFAMQAYVIVTTILSVVLLIALGWALFSSGTSEKKAESAVEREKKANNDLRQADLKLQYLQYVLGEKQLPDAEVETIISSVGTTTEVQAVKTKFDKDMGLLGPNTKEKNYSVLIVDLMKAIRERNMEIDKLKKEVDKAIQEVASIRAQETKARETAEKARADIEKDLVAAREDYRKKEAELQKSVDDVTVEKDNIAQKAKKDADGLKSEIGKREAEIASLKSEKKQAIETNLSKVQREDFESAQGRVVNVDKGGAIVFVNLGKNDGIRKGLRFNILPEDTIRISESKAKCQIEITRVFDTSSQARVIPNRLNIPVIDSDLVYSPFWSAGERVEYALVGKMDINGDGTDDREQVRSLIEASGGVVVEDVGPDTKPGKSQITFNTRFLVIGQMPSGVENASDDARLQDIGKRYQDIISRARKLSLAEMTLQKLQGFLQKFDEDRTVGLGDGSNSSDFRERAPGRTFNTGR